MNKKTVLITGSSTGFGHASAKLFADRGWNVVASMRDVSAARDLAGRDNVFVTRSGRDRSGQHRPGDQGLHRASSASSTRLSITPVTVSMGYSKRSPKKTSKVTLTSICSG